MHMYMYGCNYIVYGVQCIHKQIGIQCTHMYMYMCIVKDMFMYIQCNVACDKVLQRYTLTCRYMYTCMYLGVRADPGRNWLIDIQPKICGWNTSVHIIPQLPYKAPPPHSLECNCLLDCTNHESTSNTSPSETIMSEFSLS